MNWLLGDSPLFRKIMASILLASIFFLFLLTLVVYYSNEILEDDLLNKQTEFELKNTRELLAQNPDAALPRSASLSIYLASRQQHQPIPDYLAQLDDGIHHDIKLGDKAYHVMVGADGEDRIYIQYDVTEIERSEELLQFILLVAWIVLLALMFVIARILSRKLSLPIAQLSQALSGISPDQRGIRLSDSFEDDEVGKIAQAFDSYSRKIDDYVEKQIAFTAMASHELRSPLTIVQTSADLIASRHDNPEIRVHLEKIQRASVNMTDMIHALLAVTRDQPASTAAATPLYSLIGEIVEVMQAEIDAKNIELSNLVSPDSQVAADATLLKVVLTNLIKNAVKHGQQSSIDIEMSNAQLCIRDTGFGIDENELAQIFDFGFRGEGSQGYGVGLYISKLICDHQHWSLRLQPNPQGGCIARIDFSS